MPPLSLSQLAHRELYNSFFLIAMFQYHAFLSIYTRQLYPKYRLKQYTFFFLIESFGVSFRFTCTIQGNPVDSNLFQIIGTSEITISKKVQSSVTAQSWIIFIDFIKMQKKR